MKRTLKRILMTLLCLFVLWIPASAEEPFDEQKEEGMETLRGALDGDSRALLDGLDAQDSLTEIIAELADKTGQEQRSAISSAVSAVTGAATVLLLCSVAGSLSKASRLPPLILRLAGAMGLTAAVYQTLAGLTGQCRAAAEEIQVFSKAMLPVMMTAVSLSGTPSAAAVAYSATMFALDLCVSLITGVYVPAVSAYVAMITVNTAVGNDTLTRLASCVKWLITASLRLLLTLFFFYITISGSVSHGMDGRTVKAAKFALGSSVPVVGNILSGAADTVLAGAVTLKNSLGIFGMLCVCAICLVPFLRVGISYLIFKIGTALLSPICSKELSGLADGITDSIGLILGMLGSCSAILFFELVYSVVMTT